ncbi:MAG: rhomboid family intramembrane serine protease [Ilumatobacteraceae bacterium]
MPGRYRFSMPNERDRTDPWFRLGSVDVTTSVIISFLCVLSFFVYAADPAALNPIILYAADVRRGEVWRLFTWPIANAPSLSSVIAVAIFWYLGSRVEAQLGRVRFIWLLTLTTVLPALLATAVDFNTYEIRSLEIAIFVIFVMENPKMPFFFGIPAWILAVVIVGIDILQRLGARQSESLLVYIAGIVVALLTARSFGMLNDFPWMPKIKLPGQSRGSRKRRPVSRTVGGGSREVVVDGPWPTTPMYKPMQDQAEVDQILDKIALVGMDGLTADEKKRLNDASKRLRKGGN